VTTEKTSPPSPAVAKKAAATKIPKAERFATYAQQVRELEKVLSEDDSERLTAYYDLATRTGVTPPPEFKNWIDDIAAWERTRAVTEAVARIQTYVSMDQTEPLSAKYVGRALRELGAIDEDTAKNRIEIFAFFNTGDPREVLKRLARGAQYEKWAEHASEHLTKLKAGSKTKKGFVASNAISNTLARPIEVLENLQLAAALVSNTGKRLGNYLRLVGRKIFDGWAPWPGRKSGGPTS